MQPSGRRKKAVRCAVRDLLAIGVLALTTLACGEVKPPESVLLVVVDTLRADHLGIHGYARPTSPNIDRFAERAVVFRRGFATSPWTLPTMGSLLTGKLPSQHDAGKKLEGRDTFAKLDPEIPTIAEILGREGFSTGAIVNNPFLHPDFGIDRGFRDYDHRYTTNWIQRRADETVDLALRWIGENRGGRYFLLVHFFDPHMTYDAPRPFRRRFTRGLGLEGGKLPVEDLPGLRGRASTISDEERAFVTAAYDEEIAFVDAQMGRLFEGLRELGEWEKLLIVLTSDHGEELFEHGGFEHGHSMYDELLHVPLIVRAPGLRARAVETPVSAADVAPTLLDAMGVEPPAGSHATSLWAAIQGAEVLTERPIVSESTFSGPELETLLLWPLKVERDAGTGSRRLFNLEKDPEERNDVAAARPEVAAELGDLLDRLRLEGQGQGQGEASGNGNGAPVAAPISDETLERLRSLGYVR